MHSNNPNKPTPSKMILIQAGERTDNNTKNNILIYQEGDKQAQCNLSNHESPLNKITIDKTVKQLRESMNQNNPLNDRLETEVINDFNTNNNFDYIYQTNTPATQGNGITTQHNSTNHEKPLISEEKTLKTNHTSCKDYANTHCKNTNANIIILNTVTTDDRSFGFRACLICEKGFPIAKMLTAEGCSHLFCSKCTKNFFEEKLEQGDPLLKCPVFSCRKSFSLDQLNKIISVQHYKIFAKETNLFNIDIDDMKENKSTYLRKLDTLKFYTQRNVLDVNTNESFYIYNKAKEQFCMNCGEMALYGKSNTYFIKCLNCFCSMCRYCLKKYTPVHMDINTEDHCKVYWRKGEIIRHLDRGGCLKYLIEMFLVIAGFIFMFLGSYAYISLTVMCFPSRGYHRNTAMRILMRIVGVILFIATIPIILMSFPYFPIVITMVK